MKFKSLVQLTAIMAAIFMSSQLALAMVTWTETNNLPIGRQYHTATLLTNGKVLVTGGMDEAGTFLTDCRLYDPSTKTWGLAAPLTHARAWHSATRLADGSVLVVGGFTGGGNVYHAERYYPAINQWAPAGTHSTVRIGHTATLLTNRKVLVVGGYSMTYPQIYYGNCDLYNPNDNSWSPAGALTTPRANHTATLMSNGDVLVVGGTSKSGENDTPVASTERYNPTTGWSGDANLLEARSTHTATLLRNGQLLVAGGDAIGWTHSLLTAELYYDGAWHTTGAMHIGNGRIEHTATLLPNGTVLAAGGVSYDTESFETLAECELYNPGTKVWSATSPLHRPRTYHKATLLANGKVLAVGGVSSWADPPFGYCEVYNSHKVVISPLELLNK